MSYYNTTNLADSALSEAERQAMTQEEAILAFFAAHPEKQFTPFEVQEHALPGATITSVRRAITNLTDEGRLEKTDQTRMERYGKVNYLWTLNS